MESTGLTAAALAGGRSRLWLAPGVSRALLEGDPRRLWPGYRLALGSLSAMAATLYGIGRAAGLADLVERSIRRGDGDPELAEALRRDAEGKWD